MVKEKGWENLLFLTFVVLAIVLILIYYFWQSTYGYYGFTLAPGLSELHSNCEVMPGYYCSSAILSYITGNLTLKWGQNTGENWNSTYIEFIPVGTPVNISGVPEVSFLKTNGVYFTSFTNGNYSTINLSVAKPYELKNNTEVSGSIWVKYTVTNQISYSRTMLIKIRAS